MFFFSNGLLYTQSDPSREILVYFTSGIERSSTGKEALIRSEAVQNILTRFNIDKNNVVPAFPNFNEADTLKQLPDGKKIKMPNMAKIFKIQVPDGISREEVIEHLKKLPNVLFAEPNGTASLHVIPNDPYFPDQWGLQKIQAPEAWDIYQGSSSTKIGIVDNGVDATHPDLSGKVIGRAVVYNPEYFGYHGIHVAGIAAAKTNNAIGVAGVNWNAQIFSAPFDRYTDDPELYNIIINAVDQGCDVLNNSWGLTYPDGRPGRYSTLIRIAFAYVYKLNRVAVAAMGNTGNTTNTVEYPASFGQGIIAVGATNISDERAEFSTYGYAIDVSAPGVNILSTYRYPDYAFGSGTSIAAPFVSGVASLLKGYASEVLGIELYNDDIERIIQLSADDIYPPGWDQYTGYGRVNARRALDLLRPPYVLMHLGAIGGTIVSSTGFYRMLIFGASGLPDGVYIVKRYEVRRNVTYPAILDPNVWGRGVATVGWSIENPNYAMGWCDALPGSITQTGATLRTYVYEVWDMAGWYRGWYPCRPENVVFSYTVHGRTPNAPSNLTAIVVSASQVNLNWNDNSTDEEGFKIERKLGFNGNWIQIGIVGQNVTSWSDFDVSPGESYYYRVRAYKGEVNSPYSNTALAVTPFTYAWIDGPSVLSKGQTGTWIANPSEGSYEWRWRYYPNGSWSGIVSTSRTYSETMVGMDFQLWVRVTKFGETKDAYKIVYSRDGFIEPTFSEIISSSDINLPDKFNVLIYPNPFNPITKIKFSLPEDSYVEIKVYDVLGRKIETLLSENRKAGYHEITFDASNLPSGVYFYRIKAGKFADVKKMILMK
jgi:subtilisin family serine protease